MHVSLRSAPGAGVAKADKNASRLFVHIALISCLCLQRFGLLIDKSAVFLSLPIFAILLTWLVLSGRATLRHHVMAPYIAFVVCALVGTLLAVAAPDPSVVGISATSLLGLIVTNSLLLVGPTRRFHGKNALDIVLLYVRLSCVLGVLQYAFQYIGVQFFSLTAAIPEIAQWTVEPLYGYNSPVTYGSNIQRSNGLFFLEPSIFSQAIAMAIVIDVMIRRSYKFMLLYLFGYLVSYSGTGALILFVALTLYSIIYLEHAGHLLFLLIIFIFFVLASVFLFSDIATLIVDRANEFQSEGSSGYARYLAQGDTWISLSSDWRVFFGHGPGALERSKYWVPGSANPSLKLFSDYGIFGGLFFVLFFFAAVYRWDIIIVTITIVTTYQLGGGYQLFAPFIVFWSIIAVWSAPERSLIPVSISINRGLPRRSIP